jgi:hypothetical protein
MLTARNQLIQPPRALPAQVLPKECRVTYPTRLSASVLELSRQEGLRDRCPNGLARLSTLHRHRPLPSV